MLKNITIRQIHTEALSCEPLLGRCANGELLCVCQCGGVTEPDAANRVYAFHSRDNGETWSWKESIYPEDGQAVYCTELTVDGDEITAYLTLHSGRFLDWKCVMMKSFDNGYTWENAGPPPFFPEYTFIREPITTSRGTTLLPYQTYPFTEEEHARILREETDKAVFAHTRTPYCESGVVEFGDGGCEKYMACRMDMKDGWIWSEPTIAELADGTVVMLMRKCRSGWLYRCDSHDGGRTWSECVKTDIPNPSNKPKLIALDNDRIALIHTPNNAGMENGRWAQRFPLELWISEDGMKTWAEKIRLTDFPGSYCYADGIFEDGHIRFVIEHNRHTILYFDAEL